MPVLRLSDTQNMILVVVFPLLSWSLSDSCLHPPAVSCLEPAKGSCLFFPVPTVHMVHCNGSQHTAIPVANTSEKFLWKYFVWWCYESLYIFSCFVTLCSCFAILVPSCKVSRELKLLLCGASKATRLFKEQLLGTSTIKILYQLSHINCAYFLLI